MESQPQNPEFRNNPGNFHPWYMQIFTTYFLTFLITILTLCMLGNFSQFCVVCS